MTDLWNIRGVSEGIRRVAKSAAAMEGQTLGEWLGDAIVAESDRQRLERLANIHSPAEAEAEEIPPGPKMTVEQVGILKDQLAGPNARAKKEVKRCAHGEEKGHNCWQCVGLAVVE